MKGKHFCFFCFNAVIHSGCLRYLPGALALTSRAPSYARFYEIPNYACNFIGARQLFVSDFMPTKQTLMYTPFKKINPSRILLLF